MTLWPHSRRWPITSALTDERLVFRLPPIAEYGLNQTRDLDLGGAAGGVMPSRAIVFLAEQSTCSFWPAVEPDGAGRGGSLRRAAFLQPLYRDRPVRYAAGRGAGAMASSTCRSRCESSKASYTRVPRGSTTAFLDGLMCRSPRFLHQDPGPLIAAARRRGFILLMFSWVELLLSPFCSFRLFCPSFFLISSSFSFSVFSFFFSRMS